MFGNHDVFYGLRMSYLFLVQPLSVVVLTISIEIEGRGEIWVRGPTVFMGYYKDITNTRATVDTEGWLHSGDIGLWTTEGNLQIVDRKKNIFKLSQGEYVAPEKIENIVIQSLLVCQAFVYGDSFQSALVAILVPDEESVRKLLQDTGEVGLAKSPFAEVCKNEKLTAIVMAELKRLGQENGLHGFEAPKAVHLTDELFSVENGLLTPTFKLKRQQARDKYEKEIERMYNEITAQPRSKI
jgi:long-chain acyl-CoA synthetase